MQQVAVYDIIHTKVRKFSTIDFQTNHNINPILTNLGKYPIHVNHSYALTLLIDKHYINPILTTLDNIQSI